MREAHRPELRDAIQARDELRKRGDRAAAGRASGDHDGGTIRRKADRRRREIVDAAADFVGAPALLAQGLEELALERIERRGRRRVRARPAAFATKHAIFAPLQPSRPTGEKAYRLPSNPALAFAEFPRRATRVEGAERERDGVVGRGSVGAVETRGEIAAVRDRIAARTADDIRALAEIPADRRQRIIITAHAAHAIAPAACASDRAVQSTLNARELRRGIRVGAGARELAPHDAIFASLRGVERRLHEARGRSRDHLRTLHRRGGGE
ncbi:MAG: hypothetical protein HY271_04955 [Deltaproteobacteria bacterium]|nr:hypothetical protein [Deltaproteobacteria bacterium]